MEAANRGMRTITFAPQKRFFEGINYGFQYSLLDPKYVAYHAPVQCKDFLSDAFWSEYTRTEIVDVYGFSWKPGTLSPFPAPVYRLGIIYKEQDMQAWVGPLAAFLNEWERRLGFAASEVDPANGGKATAITFSCEWTRMPILLSAFLCFVRLGVTYDPRMSLGDYLENAKTSLTGVDLDYLRAPQAVPRVQRLLRGDSNFRQTWTQYTDVYTVHGYSGIRNAVNV